MGMASTLVAMASTLLDEQRSLLKDPPFCFEPSGQLRAAVETIEPSALTAL